MQITHGPDDLDEPVLSSTSVLPDMNAADYLAMCRVQHPELFRRLNPERAIAKHLDRMYAELGKLSTHFESKLENGRGDVYRMVQNEDYLIRSTGFAKIFDLASDGFESLVPGRAVLDSLGGNGTMTRIIRAMRPAGQTPFIVTSDVSAGMIADALAQGIPAVRQPLQNMIWFDDSIFDAVIVAYGTHHIPVDERQQAIGEALRVLKPGGKIVLQDFEIGSPTTKWYDEVLDRYTITGHKYDYFTRKQFRELLELNDACDIEVMDVYDPFVAYADSEANARIRVLSYVFTLFALEKLLPAGQSPDEDFWLKFEGIVRKTSTFDSVNFPEYRGRVREFTVEQDGDRYRAEIPRICLVATGRKPVSTL